MKTIPRHTLDFIDSWLELTTKWEETTGLSIAIMHKGEIVLEKTYGMADIETKEPLSAKHQYRVASQSKTFTAVAILQLQEKAALRIDDVAADYVPWLREHSDARWQAVTIRQLLCHGAGVMRDGEKTGFWSLHGPFPDESVLKKEILSRELVLEPNTQLKYSNFGYGLLGLIIKAASGKSYGDYVQKNIIDVLSLKHTAVDYSTDLSMATGYSRKNLKSERFAFPQLSTGALAPATGFCSTPVDMCMFFDALKVGSGKLLTDASKREMQHKQWDVKKEDDSYALGLDIAERHGYDVVGHSGGFPGFGSRTWLASNDDIVVSVIVTDHDTWLGPITSSIFAILSEFGDKEPKQELLKYEGRFAGLNSITQIVAHADGLRQIWPNGWWPMGSIDKLKVLDDKTLQIYDTSGFEDEGEKMIYEFAVDGSPKHITIAGDVYVASTDGDLKPWW